MNYGLNISASGVLTAMYRQDVFANNLANFDTAGFKMDVPATKQRDPARVEDDLWSMPSNSMLERLGAGVMLAPNRVVFEQGSLDTTGNPFDLAIMGEGFFVVRTAASADTSEVRLTRNGRFAIGSRGRLEMADSGAPVLDERNNPIFITAPGRVTIHGDGSVIQNEQVLGRLALVNVPDKSMLRKEGHSLYIASAAALTNAGRAAGQIHQGAIESSAVDEVKAIMDMTTASREVEANLSMVQQADRLMDRAINGLGRVS